MTAGQFGLPVTFAGISANTGVADSDGNEWYVQMVEGWDTPAVRLPQQDRAFQDGAFIGSGYYGSRTMIVKGVALCFGSADQQVRARTRLANAANLLQVDGTLVVSESPDKQCTVRRGGPLRMVDIDGCVEFELTLIAGNPLKQAAGAASALTLALATSAGGVVFPITPPFSFGNSASGGTGTATNAGTVNADLVATFSGPCTSPAVERTDIGARVTVDVTLTSTDSLVVDMRARTIVLNGTASRRANLRAGSQWWQLPPGSTVVRFAAAAYDPAAQLNLSWRSAWQ